MERVAKTITSMGFTIEEFEDNLNNTTYAIFKGGMGVGFIYLDKTFNIAYPRKADEETLKSIKKLAQYLEFIENNSKLEQIETNDNQVEFILMKYMSHYLTVSLLGDNKTYRAYIVNSNGEIHISEYPDKKIAIKQFILLSKALSEEELKMKVSLKSRMIDKGINLLNNMKSKN